MAEKVKATIVRVIKTVAVVLVDEQGELIEVRDELDTLEDSYEIETVHEKL